MVLPTAEWAPQIQTASAAGMSEKPNPAVNTVSHAPLQIGMGLQYRVERDLILPDKRTGAVLLVPIRAKREKSLDRYGKKARFSVTMRIDLCTPSSYPIDAHASRGRARFLCATVKNPQDPPTQTLRPLSLTQAVPLAQSMQDSLRATS